MFYNFRKGNDMKKLSILFIVLFLLISSSHATFYSASTIVNGWSSQRSPTNHGITANWQVSGSKVYNGGNVHGTIVSNFDVSNDFTLTGTMQNSGDNDSMGFVWGWQDYQNTYFLEYGGGGVGGWNGLTIYKKVNGTASQVYHIAQNWSSGTVYNVSIDRNGTSTNVKVKTSSGTTKMDHTFTDSTYMSGAVGMHTYSQTAYFWNINVDDVEAKLALGSTSTDFGNVRVGTYVSKNVTVTNTGDSGTTLTGNIGSASGEFSPASGNQSFNLGQNQSANRTFTYTPTNQGSDSSTVTVSTNEDGNSNVTLMKN